METIYKNLAPIIIGKLLHISGMLQRKGNRMLLPHGLNQHQFSIFFEIARLEKVKQKDMVNRLSLERAHVSKVVKKLEQMSLIEIKAHEDDKRSFWLSATDYGKEVLEECMAMFTSWNEDWSSEISAEQMEVIVDSLAKLQSVFIEKTNV